MPCKIYATSHSMIHLEPEVQLTCCLCRTTDVFPTRILDIMCCTLQIRQPSILAKAVDGLCLQRQVHELRTQLQLRTEKSEKLLSKYNAHRTLIEALEGQLASTHSSLHDVQNRVTRTIAQCTQLISLTSAMQTLDFSYPRTTSVHWLSTAAALPPLGKLNQDIPQRIKEVPVCQSVAVFTWLGQTLLLLRSD